MITDKQAYSAEAWIYDNIDNIAQAKSDRVKAEETLKIVRSEIQLLTEGTMAHKEASALASPKYKQAVNNYADSVRTETQFNMKLKAAETRIMLFQSVNKTLGKRL